MRVLKVSKVTFILKDQGEYESWLYNPFKTKTSLTSGCRNLQEPSNPWSDWAPDRTSRSVEAAGASRRWSQAERSGNCRWSSTSSSLFHASPYRWHTRNRIFRTPGKQENKLDRRQIKRFDNILFRRASNERKLLPWRSYQSSSPSNFRDHFNMQKKEACAYQQNIRKKHSSLCVYTPALFTFILRYNEEYDSLDRLWLDYPSVYF